MHILGIKRQRCGSPVQSRRQLNCLHFKFKLIVALIDSLLRKSLQSDQQQYLLKLGTIHNDHQRSTTTHNDPKNAHNDSNKNSQQSKRPITLIRY